VIVFSFAPVYTYSMWKKNFLKSKHFIIPCVFIPVVLLDQITKQIVHRTFEYHESIKIIPGLFNLTCVRNFGAAWGVFADASSSIRVPFFWAISIIAITGISIYLYILPPQKKLTIITFSLILSGASGNFLDRVGVFHRGGYVIDFLDFYIQKWHWPAFNVADSAISIAIGLLIYEAIMEEVNKRKKKFKSS